ncbi:MAG TPA: ribonuclease P protein component [Clostridiales bacterium]|nr:ribonuclease P protein component [Clostridiales bacterium]
MRFTKSLNQNADFHRLYRRGKKDFSKTIAVYFRRNGGRGQRLGITVSAKLGGAVVRNRLKRRIREMYRIREERMVPGYDIVIVARAALIGAPFSRLERDFDRIFIKNGLMTVEKP